MRNKNVYNFILFKFRLKKWNYSFDGPNCAYKYSSFVSEKKTLIFPNASRKSWIHESTWASTIQSSFGDHRSPLITMLNVETQ